MITELIFFFVMCHSMWFSVSVSMGSNTGLSFSRVRTSLVSVLNCVTTVPSSRALGSARTASTPLKSTETARKSFRAKQCFISDLMSERVRYCNAPLTLLTLSPPLTEFSMCPCFHCFHGRGRCYASTKIVLNLRIKTRVNHNSEKTCQNFKI